MAEGRNVQGGVGSAGLKWWQKGSTQQKPSYFISNAYGKAVKAQAPYVKQYNKYYTNQYGLIDQRNDFYKSYNPNISEPKYSFADAMRLSQYGYTGLFGRSQSKQTLGLLGEEWQRAYALDRLRKGKQMLSFSLMANAPTQVLKDTAAATMIVPGSGKYNNLLGLYTSFGDKYGTGGAKYAERYGHLPTIGSKYGILFNTNNQKIRRDDVNVTYQNNLSANSVRVGKFLVEQGKKQNSDEMRALGLQYLAYGDYKVKSAQGEYNRERVAEMESALKDFTQMSGRVNQALSGDSAAQSAFGRVATGLLGLTSGIPGAGTFLASEEGNKLANEAISYMNGLSDSDPLKSRKIYWTSMKGGFSQFGLIGLQGNILRDVARMGLGLPTGLTLASDEAYLAGKETAKWASSEGKYDWGSGVDFKIGDAIWKDYAERYYDPFAYDAKGEGRHWWQGLGDASSYDRVGDKIGANPTAYVLDALDVAPMIGVAAKAGGLAAIGARTGKVFGKVGLTSADEAALKAARVRAADGAFTEYSADEITNAQSLIDSLSGKPHLIDTVDQGVLEEAARIVTDQAAREELSVIENKFAQAPSARTFRRTARAAYNGDQLAIDELSRWRALGYDFRGAERSFGVKAGALFEPRTKVLEKPESVLEAAPNAVYRLPASPIMRGLKEAFFWVGRGIDRATISASEKAGVTGRVGTKLIDMPLLSYRYNYTKAVKQAEAYLWGDINTEMQRAARLIQIDNEAGLTPEMARAVEANLMGGEGAMPLQYPAIQRQQVQDKIAMLPRDKRTGEVIPAARPDLANLEKQLSELLDNEIRDMQEAAASFDDKFDQHLTDLRMRLSDSTYKADDVMLDKAVDLYRRMDRQDQAVRSRIVHEDTTPNNVEHLKMLYSEAMDGLRLSATRLFGKNGKSGRVGRYATKVLRVNTNMLLRGLSIRGDRNSILSLAQHPTDEGTVFDTIADAGVRKQREDQMVEAFDALDRSGMFVDGLGSYGTPGRPVLVMAKQDVGKDFVAFHIPTLRHEMSSGKIINGKIIDPNEVFVLPRVFFATKKAGKVLVMEPVKQARKLLYEGALNAMASVYPKARFYSEKLNDTGLRGTRQNEQMIANEHQVAQTGMRQHALSRIVQSQVYYLRSRVERDLRTLAESQAVLVPAAQVVGKTASESGYHVLHNVRVFDNASDALDFARLRGVSREAEETLGKFADGTLEPVESTLDITSGLGVRMVDGKPEFIVRGGTHDWLNEAIQENITEHSTTKAWVAREFSDPNEIPRNGMVLAIPDRAFKDLAEMTIEADNLSARLLNSTGVKGWSNLFKWFVLNANPGFIANNVIGGLAMMLMMNPAASGNVLASVIQRMARESIQKRVNNDAFTLQLAHFKNESEAVARQLAYEFDHNIYRQDAGLMGAVEGVPWFKKYVWHGGYTTVSAWEAMMRRNIAMQFLRKDAGFQSFMRGPEVKKYIEDNVDWNGNVRGEDEGITPFEAATDLLLDPSSPYYNMQLKHRMRYMTNTVSGNYHQFTPMEQLMRNVVMPFYAWQRHSAMFSYRMLVDRPITTTALYNLGQQGYQQNAEQGLPEWMMQTIPAPQVIKDLFGITDDDFRLDGNALSPFGTTGDMGMAAFSLLTGAKSNNNVFEFTNPYLNSLIKDTLGVDPVTGRIDWTRLSKDGTSAGGLAGMGKDMFTNVFKATYPYKLAELAKYDEYKQDALSNKYAAVENASDILKNYDPSNPKDPWRLSIPKMRSAEAQDPTQRVFSALGIKSYRVNPMMLPMSGRRDAVGAIVLKYINDADNADEASKAVSSAQEWQRKFDYVTQVWLPVAEAQGLDPSVIQFVLNKIKDERPKTGIAKRLTMMGG